MEKEHSILEELLKRKGRKARLNKENKRPGYNSSSSKSKSKEIIVKVARKDGRSKGHGHTKSALKYCLHYIINGTEDKTIRTNFGQTFSHKEVDPMVNEYSEGFKESKEDAKHKNRLFSHVIISLPNNVEDYSSYNKYNDKKLKKILEDVSFKSISEKYPLNDFMVAVQDNGKNLHVHIPIICKGRNNKKIYINKEDIQEIRELVVKKLQDYKIHLKATSFLDKNHKAKPKIKRIHLEQNFNVGEAYKEKAPNWVKEKDKLNQYELVSKNFKNKKELNKFNELGSFFQESFKKKDNALKSFLLMYKEDKALATWVLFENPKALGELITTKNKIITKINIRNINTDILIKRDKSFDIR